MDKIIGITNAPDDAIMAGLNKPPIAVLAHGKYVGGHIVIYEDSQQIASGDLIDGQDVGGTGTYAYSLTPIEGYSGYDDAKSYRLVIDGDEIDRVKNGILTNLPFDAMYIIADFGRGMQVTQTYPDLSSVSVSQTKTVTTKKYQTKRLDKSLLPDSVERGIEAANTKAATALSAAQSAQDTANEAISSANTAQNTAEAAQTTANTAKSTAETALPKTGGTMSGNIIVGEGSGYRVETSRTSIRVKYTNSVTGNVSNELEMLGAPTPAVTGGNGNGAFYIGSDGLTVGNESNNNGRITLLHNAGSSTDAHISILHRGKYLTLTSSGKISSNSRVTFENGEIEVGLPTGQTGNTAIILRSYSAGSTKRFRITVDDTGTLKATEVTDA